MATSAEQSVAAPSPVGHAAPALVIALAPQRDEDLSQVPPPPPPAVRAGWRYLAGDRRDLRLDLLRGFAVFAMVVDHIGGASWLYALTGGNRFFVSAAEAFVFISGLTVGIVYGDRLRRDGLRSVTTRLLARAWTLYVLAVWLAIGTAFFAAIFGLPRGVFLTDNPARFIVEVITLQRTFYLVDVMLLYAFLLALSPLALAALKRGAWWGVLIASCALWALYQAFPGLTLPWPILDNPVFNFAPWQLLFFSGLLLGYGREWLARAIGDRIPRSPLRDGWVTVPLVLFAGLVYLHATNAVALARFAPGGDTAAWLDFWFDKSALPLPRLVACAIVFATFWLVATRFWVPIRRFAGRLLLPLGERALYAYAAHLFLIVVIQMIILKVWGHGREVDYSTLHPGVDALIQVAGIGLLWGLTRARFLHDVLAPLGRPPFTEARWQWRRWSLPRPSDALAALLIAALVSGLLLVPGGWGLRGPDTGAEPSPVPGSGASAAGGARPESTVTVPRRVAGAVRGSSGLTGRSDQPSQPPGAANGTPAIVAPLATAVAGAQPGGAVTPTPTNQASGGYLIDGEFFSAALSRPMPFGIYLPPSYDSEPERHYPVLYMLHGGGGHYSEWVAYGLPEKAEDLTWDGQIQPLIIVMPQGDQSYWSNHPDTDGERWGDYIAFDLVAHIDATFRTIPQASSRAIGGLSMGGFGALQLAFNHPDIFSAVGGHSPALHNHERLRDIFASDEVFAANDPLELAAHLDPETAPRVWVDTGAEDDWADRAVALALRLDERGIKHEVRILPGRHDADYWVGSVSDYLRFYSQAIVGGPVGVRPPG